MGYTRSGGHENTQGFTHLRDPNYTRSLFDTKRNLLNYCWLNDSLTIPRYPCILRRCLKIYLTKTETGENEMFVRKIEKMDFLRDQSKEEEPLFLAFCETGLTKHILEAEFSIDGYTHVASHRVDRRGGGVIIYIRQDVPYKILTTVSDEMCSTVAVHLEKLNAIVFMVYRPPVSYKGKYHGEFLEKSFKDIVIKNIYNEMNKFKAPTPDIILAGDFNFPKDQNFYVIEIPCKNY